MKLMNDSWVVSFLEFVEGSGNFWNGQKRAVVHALLAVYFVLELAITHNNRVNAYSHNTVSRENETEVHLLTAFVVLQFLAVVLSLCLTWYFTVAVVDGAYLTFDSCIIGLDVGWCVLKSFNMSNDRIFMAINIFIGILLITIDLTTQFVKASTARPINFSQFYRRRLAQASTLSSVRALAPSAYSNIRDDCCQVSASIEDDPYDSHVVHGDEKSGAIFEQDIEVGLADSPNNSPTNSLKLQSIGGAGNTSVGSDNTANSIAGGCLINTNNNHNNSNSSVGEIFLSGVNESDVTFDGFRLALDALPPGVSPPQTNILWEAFTFIEHRIDSSSCHIYTAVWNGSPVIVKLIKADRVNLPVAVQEFETEATILSRVRHPNIVRLLGSGHLPRRFLVLELLEGGSLSHSLGLRPNADNKMLRKKFSYKEALMLARAMAQALHYLHTNWHKAVHIIHRDLKPDNIGWTGDGVLKLFDFGLCACVRAQRDKTEQYKLTGNTGTLRYMAPEVALGRSYNKSVDVYSFGMIVWQVLKGAIPFKDMTKKIYMEKVVVGGTRPHMDRRWPEQLKVLLRRCWHEDKNLRPDFGSVLTELDALIHEAEDREMSGFMYWRTYIVSQLPWLQSALMWCRPIFVFLFLLCGAFAIGVLLYKLSGDNYNRHCLGAVLMAVAVFGVYLIVLSYVPGSQRRGVLPQDLIMGLELGLSPANLRNQAHGPRSHNPLMNNTASSASTDEIVTAPLYGL